MTALPSLHEIVKRYPTDKEECGYIPNYIKHLEALRDQPVILLELGVLKGGSLLMWQDYFPHGTILGLDRKPCEVHGERIRVYQGDQQHPGILDRIAAECAPNGFDIIVDDAAHVGKLARASFWHLFPKHLKPGGLYIIDDWGTGYWGDWPDGAAYGRNRGRLMRWLLREDPNFTAHNAGMVGFIKELVDDCATEDITAQRGNGQMAKSRIAELTLYKGQAYVRKVM